MEQQQNEYYTPELSEMYIGYEYERAEVHGFAQFEDDGMLPIRSWHKEVVGIEEQDERDIVNIPINTFTKYYRTKYLSRECIESEGWVHEGGVLVSWGRQDYSKGEWILQHWVKDHEISIIYSGNKMYSDDEGDVLVRGIKCPSINEFRKIIKALGIK